eukprot:gene3097-4068_t
MTDKKHRSGEWFARDGKYGFLPRSWMKSQGFSSEMLDGRPVIGICNTWSELTNCNRNLRELAEHVKRGVLMAGGFPLAGVVGRADVMDAPAPGGLGGTYAGSPVACAAALAVIEAFAQEKLLARSQDMGALLVRSLKDLAARIPAIGDVRGLGAMVAIELFENGDLNRPDAALTKQVVAEAARRGLILLSCGTHGNVIRILVPLTASDEL